MDFLFLALILLAVPFIVPIAAWVSARRTRNRLETLVQIVESQRSELNQLRLQVTHLRLDIESGAAATPVTREPGIPAATPVAPPVPTPVPPAPVAQPVAPKPAAAVPSPVPPPAPRVSTPPVVPTPPERTDSVNAPVRPPLPPRPPAPPEPPAPTTPGFDWENLVGVKLFSAIAGVALVFAAVFFLRYTIEHGWLQPRVRVAIGVIVAIALLVVCELKAARRYPATADAMDAAAIAILFSTFFAAHALWNLIGSTVAFVLLAVVTLVAVLLSIRRESLFIAVLGLLGGFATPALLSTGENRPIPLFAYLLLLNVGLAWVARSKHWPVLSWLTLLLTTIYQWGWVLKFLDESSLTLAMGVFLVFPLAAIVGLVLGKRAGRADSDDADDTLERTALLSATLPVIFVVYLAAVPAYGAHAALLLGFLLLIDLGLLAIAVAQRQEALHAAGAVSTMLAMAVWLGMSYQASAAWAAALGFTSAFVVLYLMAPVVAEWFDRPFEDQARQAHYAAPLMLFACPVLARIEPAMANPWPLAATMLALVLVIAWRALVSGVGPLYYTAAFFAIAMQAVWSTTHLTLENLGTAVAMYTLFGLVALGVPIVARRQVRALTPTWGSGAVTLVSLGLLFFLSAGPVAPAALWALALLLAILNAGLFIESAAGRLPIVSQAGSVLSWVILMVWWNRAAASVGVLSSLTVLAGLALVTLAGHGWSVLTTRSSETDSTPPGFAQGLYLSLFGHLFLLFLVLNREWALPPWPVFATLAAITLAMSATAVWIRIPSLHAAGAIAASIVVAAWASAAGSPEWGVTAVVASAAASAYALAWIPLAGRFGGSRLTAAAAGAALFGGELALLLGVGGGAVPPFPIRVIAHAVNIGVLLALTSHYRWKYVAIAAVAPAWLAVAQLDGDQWTRLLVMSGILYAIFAAYPLALGSRARGDRDPYLAAVIASAMFFVAARSAFLAGGLEHAIGIVPVVESAVLAVLLQSLLRLEPAGQRDMGRLALVAGAALAFVTVAIPLQLRHQWITIGWALEGAALAWVFRRIPHRGLLFWSIGLLGAVFARLSVNPEVWQYEPRGAMRILNWYLYTYLISAVALMIAGWWFSKTDDRIAGLPRPAHVLPGAGVVLLFILLNIEIADFYATGPAIAFRFGVTVSQDLTYTIGWLVFGMLLLAAGIYLKTRPARMAAVSLIAVTTFKCFLYDLGSLEGLYRVASFVGLAFSLALVALALQKFVLSKPRSAT